MIVIYLSQYCKMIHLSVLVILSSLVCAQTFTRLTVDLEDFFRRVSWIDYDNDGDPDLIVNGSAIGSGANTILYRNENGQVLVDAGGPFKDVDTGDVAWADYDGDGDQDVLISGRANDWVSAAKQ